MRAFLDPRLPLSWSGRAAALIPPPLFIFPTPGINFPFSSAATLKWRFGAPLARRLGFLQKGLPSSSRMLRCGGSAFPLPARHRTYYWSPLIRCAAPDVWTLNLSFGFGRARPTSSADGSVAELMGTLGCTLRTERGDRLDRLDASKKSGI